jgi:hypothetical protein
VLENSTDGCHQDGENISAKSRMNHGVVLPREEVFFGEQPSKSPSMSSQAPTDSSSPTMAPPDSQEPTDAPGPTITKSAKPTNFPGPTVTWSNESPRPSNAPMASSSLHPTSAEPSVSSKPSDLNPPAKPLTRPPGSFAPFHNITMI